MYLVAGALLGAVRQNSFAGRPRDIDLCVFQEDRDSYVSKMEKHLCFRLGMRMDAYFKKEGKVRFLSDTCPIDIYIMVRAEENEDFLECKGFQIPAKDLEIIRVEKIYGESFRVPVNAETLLETWYGPDWHIPRPYRNAKI